MAEFPDLGTHCALVSCKQIDFLPFYCDSCNLTFCKEHRSRTVHVCTSESETPPQQPVCLSGPVSRQCHIVDCRKKEISPFICEKCHQLYCLQHRLPEDHDCQKLEEYRAMKPAVQNAAALISEMKQINESKTEPGSVKPARKPRIMSTKAVMTATKVALMKLKMNSIGDQSIPQEERVYLNVESPSSSGSCETGMFFSQRWSVGRLIDNAATLLKLENHNNTANSAKLMLFYSSTNDSVLEFQTTVGDCLGPSGPVLNGGRVRLEYLK